MRMMFRLVQQCLDPRLRETPRPCIQRLLLRPYDILRVGVHVEVLAQLFPRKGIQLFDARDGGGLDVVLLAVVLEGNVDLAGADYDSLYLFGGIDLFGFVSGIGDDPLEVRVTGEVGDGGTSERVS